MQFSPEEMASIYRQAKNKQDQIKVFVDCNQMPEDQVRKLLVEHGIKPQQLPRKNSKSIKRSQTKRKEAPETDKTEPPSVLTDADGQKQKFGDLAARMVRLLQISGVINAGFLRIEEEISTMEEAVNTAR